MTRTKILPLLLIGLALFAGCSRSTRQSASKGKDDETAASAGKSGQRVVLQNKGSDTLVNVAQAWAEEYKTVNPTVAIAVTGGGSGTGISALINGTVDLANSSRTITEKEIGEAKQHGVTPKEFTVGYDALAVFIHKNNPIKEFSLEQLADIYAEGGKTEKWSQLGVKIPGCDSDEIVRISRQNNSGTYVYFKEAVLGEGKEYRFGSRDMHGSKDVVDLVAKTPCAIGYSGLAYATPDVNMPCIKKADGQCVAPSMETAVNRSYPVARPLFMYTNGEPKGHVKEYLDWILSDKGQCIIVDKGYASARPLKCK